MPEQARIYLAQCLCGPNRHAILAFFTPVAPEIPHPAQLLQVAVDEAIAGNPLPGFPTINPWCGICGAKRESWLFEVNPTAFQSIEEAYAAGYELEAKQRADRTTMDALGLTVDSKRNN